MKPVADTIGVMAVMQAVVVRISGMVVSIAPQEARRLAADIETASWLAEGVSVEILDNPVRVTREAKGAYKPPNLAKLPGYVDSKVDLARTTLKLAEHQRILAIKKLRPLDDDEIKRLYPEEHTRS